MLVFKNNYHRLAKRKAFLLALKKAGKNVALVKQLLKKAKRVELDAVQRILVMICQKSLGVSKRVGMEQKLKSMKVWRLVLEKFVKFHQMGNELRGHLIKLAPVVSHLAAIGLAALTSHPAHPPPAAAAAATAEVATTPSDDEAPLSSAETLGGAGEVIEPKYGEDQTGK